MLRVRAMWSGGCLSVAASGAAGQLVQSIQFIGQDSIASGAQHAGTTVGGLSGLVYDAGAARYLALSDDASQVNPARWYTLSVALAGAQLLPGGVTVTGVTTLRQPGGQPFAPLSLDPEGIALTPSGDVWISSEGQVNAAPQIAPFVHRFSAAGAQVQALPVPGKFLPTTGSFGVRYNLALEPLTLAPGGAVLFTATENALKQDGPATAPGVQSPSRILRYDLATGQPGAEYVYVNDGIAGNGLVDLIALSTSRFLAMERGSLAGGNTIRLYEVALAGATDVSAFATLPGAYTPAQKTLVLDLTTLGIPLGNVEGMAFGPWLPDGRRSLVLVSDNNFSAGVPTRVFAFAVVVPAAPGATGLPGIGASPSARRR